MTTFAVSILAVVFITVCGGCLLRLGGAALLLGGLVLVGPGFPPRLTIAGAGMVMWLAGHVHHRLRHGHWRSRTAGFLSWSALSASGRLTRLGRFVLASDVRGRAGSG